MRKITIKYNTFKGRLKHKRESYGRPSLGVIKGRKRFSPISIEPVNT